MTSNEFRERVEANHFGFRIGAIALHDPLWRDHALRAHVARTKSTCLDTLLLRDGSVAVSRSRDPCQASGSTFQWISPLFG